MRIKHLQAVPITQNHSQSVFRQALVQTNEIKGQLATMNYAWLNQGMHLEPHTHIDGYELYFIISGQGTITISGAFALYPMMTVWAD